MIADKFVDLYARNSGMRDKLVAERDVVLTYVLQALDEADVMKHLAFKGGTCLRKTVFGSAGRFSEDLDFTLDTDKPEDDVLIAIVDVFNRDHYGISFTFDEYYKTDGDTSFGGEVGYRHAWNAAGRFRLQVSLRERPTLPAAPRPLKPQAYFRYLEFEPCEVRSLEVIEMIAEKVRAAYQRAKVRDLYDLHCFAAMPVAGERTDVLTSSRSGIWHDRSWNRRSRVDQRRVPRLRLGMRWRQPPHAQAGHRVPPANSAFRKPRTPLQGFWST